MKIHVSQSFIEKVVQRWEDEETSEIIEAIVAELKKDCRKECLYCSQRRREEIQSHYDGLIVQVQNEEFWVQMDHLLHFNFEY